MHLPVLSTGLGMAGIEVAGAAGVWFRLADGRRVIDASNTAAPLGHAHPDLVAVVRGASGSPVLYEGWLWQGRQRAADDLLEHVFAGEEEWVGAVRFCTSASEANDLALSLAQALTGRSPLVTRERAYLGSVGLAREVTVQPHWHGGLSSARGGESPVPRLADVRQIPAPSCGVHAPCAPDGGCRCLPADLAGTLGDAAAVIIDYSQGGVQAAPAYQDQLARAAREAGALWIADEALTGLGRQGRWLTLQRGQSRPDIVTMGKGLAGGVTAAGAVVVSQRVAGLLRDRRWHSLSPLRGHPLTVAAISATVRRIARDGLVERADALDATLRRRLAELAAAHACVRRVAGLGLHWIVELRGGVWRTSPAGAGDPAGVAPILAAALDAGVLIAADVDEESLFLAPPLIVSDGELDTILVALDRALTVADLALLPAAGQEAQGVPSERRVDGRTSPARAPRGDRRAAGGASQVLWHDAAGARRPADARHQGGAGSDQGGAGSGTCQGTLERSRRRTASSVIAQSCASRLVITPLCSELPACHTPKGRCQNTVVVPALLLGERPERGRGARAVAGGAAGTRSWCPRCCWGSGRNTVVVPALLLENQRGAHHRARRPRSRCRPAVGVGSWPGRLGSLVMARNRVGLLAALAVDNFGSGLFLPVALLYVTRVVGLPLAVAGTVVSAGTVAGLGVPAVAARVVDRVGALRVLVGAEVLQLLGTLTYLAAHGAAVAAWLPWLLVAASAVLAVVVLRWVAARLPAAALRPGPVVPWIEGASPAVP